MLCCAIIPVLTFVPSVQGQEATSSGDVRTFAVTARGDRGDGVANDTRALQATIEACADSGGGRVVVPAGKYAIGSVRLRSNVELHLAKDARLVGVDDLDAYCGFESGDWGKSRWNRGLIVGEGLHNIAITGAGTIDGNKVFDPQGEAGMRGPHTVLLSDCENVTLKNVTIRDSANYAFFFYASRKVRVTGATFDGGWDGIHFRGSPERWNEDVLISGCRFFTGDDSIAGHYIKNGLVKDCRINSSCNGVRLIGPAQGLTFKDCHFEGPGKFEHRTPKNLHRTNMLAGILLQPSAWTPTPGSLEDVLVQDVTMQNVACALHVSIRAGNTADRLTFERISATEVYSSAVSFESWAEEPIGQVTVRELTVGYTPDVVIDPRLGRPPTVQEPIRKPGVGVWNRKLPVWGLYARRVNSLQLEDVILETSERVDARPVVLLEDVKDATVDDLQHSPLPAGVQAIERRDVNNTLPE